jgi:hypothetical protein
VSTMTWSSTVLMLRRLARRSSTLIQYSTIIGTRRCATSLGIMATVTSPERLIIICTRPRQDWVAERMTSIARAQKNSSVRKTNRCRTSEPQVPQTFQKIPYKAHRKNKPLSHMEKPQNNDIVNSICNNNNLVNLSVLALHPYYFLTFAVI